MPHSDPHSNTVPSAHADGLIGGKHPNKLNEVPHDAADMSAEHSVIETPYKDKAVKEFFEAGQRDTYLGVNTKTDKKVTTGTFTHDLARKEKLPVGQVIFPVNSADVQAAYVTLAGDSAHHSMAELAKKVDALLRENTALEILTIGHASATGKEAGKNLSLSQDRAKDMVPAIDAAIGQIDPYPDIMARIHATTEAVGDTQLTVHTVAENAKNRNAEVFVTTGRLEAPVRINHVVHVTQRAIDAATKKDAPVELSTVARGQASQFSGDTYVPVAGIGSVVVEPGIAIAKVPHIALTEQAGNDIDVRLNKDPRFADPKVAVTYRYDKPRQEVTILADGKPAFVLDYHVQDGPLQEKDILIVKGYDAQDRAILAMPEMARTAEVSPVHPDHAKLTALTGKGGGAVMHAQVTAMTDSKGVHVDPVGVAPVQAGVGSAQKVPGTTVQK